jgi:hypothetical protein
MMKRLTLIGTVALLGMSGCVTANPDLASTPPMRSGAFAAPVRGEQVNQQNAQKMSQALADELDREAQHEISAAALPK